jgi:hypothetical protein
MECRIDDLSMFSPFFTLMMWKTNAEILGNGSYLGFEEVLILVKNLLNLRRVCDDNTWFCTYPKKGTLSCISFMLEQQTQLQSKQIYTHIVNRNSLTL